MKSYPSSSASWLHAQSRDSTRIASFRNGNGQALNDFYLMHRREFIKWSERMFGIEPTEADDVYQDAMLILCENIRRGKLEGLEASLKTYFFGIGKNLILKRMVRQKNEKKRWEKAHEEGLSLLGDVSCECEEMQREACLEAVTKALKGLSERNQTILTMYYYHQMPLKTIAQQLGYESVDVVKNQKVRCLKYLRKLVEGQLVSKREAA